MKVAVIDTTIDEQLIGGGHLFLPSLLSGLVSRNYEVHLITKNAPNAKVLPKIEKSGVSLHFGLWEAGGFVEDTTEVLAKWVNDLAPDIYLISASKDIGWTVLPVLESNIARFAIAHSDQNAFYIPMKHYSRFLDAAVGVSEDICSKIRDECGFDQSKICCIPYGVKIRESLDSENAEPIQLVYVGRLEQTDKRSEHVINIVKLLERRDVEYKFRIIGDGTLKDQFIGRLAPEIASGKVEMLGWLESEKVEHYLRRSDIFLLTSDSEGFSIAMIEAAANGCCLLVTDIKGGNQELVRNGINGFRVSVGDDIGFVERISWLAGNRKSLQKIRGNAIASVRMLSVGNMVGAYEELFRKSSAEGKDIERFVEPEFPLMETCRSKYPRWLRMAKKEVSKMIGREQ